MNRDNIFTAADVKSGNMRLNRICCVGGFGDAAKWPSRMTNHALGLCSQKSGTRRSSFVVVVGAATVTAAAPLAFRAPPAAAPAKEKEGKGTFGTQSRNLSESKKKNGKK